MTGSCVVCDFDNGVHDLVSRDGNSACGSLEVFADCVSAIGYSEGLPPVPDPVFGEEACDSVRVVSFVAVAAIFCLQLFDLFDVFEPSQSAFDVSHGATPFVGSN